MSPWGLETKSKAIAEQNKDKRNEDEKNEREECFEEQSSEGLELTDKEKSLVDERTSPNALVLHEVIRKAGEDELSRPAIGLALSALAAGLAMGFSPLTESVLSSHLPDAPWRPLISKLGYTVGFLIVITGQQQLFTENTLTPVLPLLSKPKLETLGQLLRLWAIVLVANLVGALVFAWVIGNTATFGPDVRHAFHDLGTKAFEGGFGVHVLRGIFAGWLIALVVWMLPGAQGARPAVIIIITYIVGLAELSHVIAGSVETLYLVTTGAASWSAYLGDFLAPVLLGNILGGVTLVAALNFGQVAPGK